MKGTTRLFAALLGAAALAVPGREAVPAPAETTAQAVAVYDAFDDFSSTSNPVPGGVWRYGYTWSLGGPLNLFPECAYNPDPRYAAISHWTYNGWWYWISVARNDSGHLIDWENSVRLPASDYLQLHPGVMGEYTVVRFTAPGAGTYLLEGAFRALRLRSTGWTTTDVHVLHNSRSLFDGFINAYWEDGDQPFQPTLALAAGDTVDFVVGVGQNGNHSGDSTGMRATISLLSSPDPATLLGGLQGELGGLTIDAGVKSSLASKLDQVAKLLAAGNEKSAANVLGAFLNEIAAQTGKKIDAASADRLAGWATAILGLLEGR